LGSVIGADKTLQGTPDTFARQENGRLVFAEYTTQQDGLSGKLQEDLAKCLNEEKTGVPISEIDEIIFCHNSRLSTDEENDLVQQGKNHGIKIRIFGIESISFDLYSSFLGLARDFLNVNIDSGQILTQPDFVKTYDKNQYTTPLNTEFFFREGEIKQTLGFLKANNLVLLSGSAGVGKSRMALEVLKRYKESHPEYEVRCILNRGQDLFEDLKVYFSCPGNFLVFVDDANLISRFDYIVHLLQDQKDGQTIKVLATVRDYSLDKVKDAARPLGGSSEVQLEPFTQAQIKELAEKLFNITNPIWQERIWEIARGNPRLAIMAAQTAIKEENLNSLSDVSTLYDQYFSSIREDLEQLDDENVIKTAGVICFFRTVDQSNESLMNIIRDVFGLDQSTFWKAAQRLHDFELADIYENDVVKISDQVLATYLFNLCVFKKETIGFTVLLNQFFPDQLNRICDSIYPCLNAFDFDKIAAKMQPAVKAKWEEYRQKEDEENLRKLIETFWFILETDALTYIRDSIESISPETVPLESIEWETSRSGSFSNSLLELLTLFRQGSDTSFQIAVNFILRYLEKRPKALPEGLNIFSKSFGFNRHSHLSEYKRQHIVIDALIKKTKEGAVLAFSKLFVELAKTFLHTKLDSTEGNKTGITIYNFSLLATPSIFELRKKIWECLFRLHDVPALQKDIFSVFRHYSQPGYYVNVPEIAAKDAELLFPFIESKLDPENFINCMMVQDYLKILDRRQIAGVEQIESRFNTQAFRLYNLLALDYADKPDGMDLNDFQAYKRDLIKEHTKDYKFEDYKNLIAFCQEIMKELGGSHESHEFGSGILIAFDVLAERDLSLYRDVIKFYLSLGDPLRSLVQPYLLSEKLIEACGPDEALHIIESHDNPTKRQWLFCYCQALKAEQVQTKHLESLYALYRQAELSEMPYDFDYLLKYRSQDENVVLRVVEILNDRTEPDAQFGRSFSLLFNSHSEVNKNLPSFFKNALPILKKTYILHENVNKHSDFNGHTMNIILDLDPRVINEHIDSLYKDKDYLSRYDDSRDYNFLWKRNDVETIMNSVIEQILAKEKEKGSLRGNILEGFFCVNDRRPSPPENIEKQDAFLFGLIKDKAKNKDMMALIFGTISHFEPERRRNFVSTLLSHNQNFSAFEALPLEPDSWGWSGSAVPMISVRIDYWQSLLPLVESVELLDHRQFIEERIQGLQRYMESEKKADFIKD
ncbi:MAG: hypothetical protein ABIU05_12510, partial [Nitrospirales bacterium]